MTKLSKRTASYIVIATIVAGGGKAMYRVYRVIWSDGTRASEHSSLADASDAIRTRNGWDAIALSESFAVGQCEGARGSVYGQECFCSAQDLEAHPDGAPFAPRILTICGDEAWAMGDYAWL